MKGYVVVEDMGRKRTKVSLSNVVDRNALQAFATAFDSYTNCRVVEAAIVDPIAINGTTQAGVYQSVENKALLTFRYVDNNERKHFKMSVPAPDDDVIEYRDGIGYRVTRAQGDALAAMLRTVTGIQDITFSKGTYLSHPTQPQV